MPIVSYAEGNTFVPMLLLATSQEVVNVSAYFGTAFSEPRPYLTLV